MIKIAIVVCLAALASAEADAWYSPYYNMYGNNWNMGNNGFHWNRPGMQEGYRFNYGKRSADAEPEAEADAEADADAWYGPYSHWNMNNNWMSYNNMYNYMNYMNNNMYNNMYNNMNYMNNNMYNNMNYMNRPSYSQ